MKKGREREGEIAHSLYKTCARETVTKLCVHLVKCSKSISEHRDNLRHQGTVSRCDSVLAVTQPKLYGKTWGQSMAQIIHSQIMEHYIQHMI